MERVNNKNPPKSKFPPSPTKLPRKCLPIPWIQAFKHLFSLQLKINSASTIMKLTKILPKVLFKSKKSHSISISDPPSFSSNTTSSSLDIKNPGGSATPTSVLPEYFKREELESVLSMLGAEPDELEMMMSRVSLEVIGSAFGGKAENEELSDVFDFFDTDGDGKITAEELLSVFGTIGDRECTLEECQRMIGEVDGHGDGYVCFKDFCRMMDQYHTTDE